MANLDSLLCSKGSEQDEGQEEIASPKKTLFSTMRHDDQDYCLGYHSRCENDRQVDFAQKYLFKKSDEDFELRSQTSDHTDESCYSDEDVDSLCQFEEPSLNELSEKKGQCNDMNLCGDWASSRQPQSECKRKIKMEIKEPRHD